METEKISIGGMTCGGCVASVERVLRALDGVEKVDVSLERAEAMVDYVPDRVTAARLRTAIEGAGFEVSR
jgi:copper chaperone